MGIRARPEGLGCGSCARSDPPLPGDRPSESVGTVPFSRPSALLRAYCGLGGVRSLGPVPEAIGRSESNERRDRRSRSPTLPGSWPLPGYPRLVGPAVLPLRSPYLSGSTTFMSGWSRPTTAVGRFIAVLARAPDGFPSPIRLAPYSVGLRIGSLAGLPFDPDPGALSRPTEGARLGGSGWSRRSTWRSINARSCDVKPRGEDFQKSSWG
jgi:hypothetical protein